MSDGPILHGQQFDTRVGVVQRFTEQVRDYDGTEAARVTGAEGTASTDITPMDRAAAKVRTWDLSAIQAAYQAEFVRGPRRLRVEALPDVLDSITVSYNKSSGEGSSSYPVSQQGAAFTGSGSAGVSPRGSAQGSAAILPNVSWTATRYRDIEVNGEDCYFYLTETATIAQVLTELTTQFGTTVSNLPIFKPKSHQIALNGSQVSVRVVADTDASVSGSSTSEAFSYRWGGETSKEVGVSVRNEILPPMLHGIVDLTPNSDTAVVTVSATANSVPLYLNGAVAVATITNERSANATASASLSPATLPATTPTNIPTSGYYLVDVSYNPADFDLVLVRATVVDFSQYG